MNAKPSVFYPAVIFASVLVVVGLVLASLQFTITIEPSDSETALIPDRAALGKQSLSGDPTAELSSSSLPKSVKQKTPAQSSPQSPAIAGALRVSNKTEQPLRMALLARQSTASSSAASKPKYSEPIHWDFAPGEGSSQGLILSLPQGNLKLKQGDILVAFAQDGSRRYWGPYVVGETTAPILNRKTSEWQLILQP
jgi:hypothetical protein